MRIETLPDDSPKAPQKYLVRDRAGNEVGGFVDLRDAQYWLDMTSEAFDPASADQMATLDLVEGSRRS